MDRPNAINPRGPYAPNLPQAVNDGGQAGQVPPLLTRTTIVKPYHIVSGASTNATLVNQGPNVVSSIWATNINAAIRYLKFFDKGTVPIPGTDIPVWVSGIPGNAAGAGGTLALPRPITFLNGLGICIVVGAADLDATATALNEIVVSFAYEYVTSYEAFV